MEEKSLQELPDRSPSGRPTVYNSKVHGRLVHAFRMGAVQQMACNYAGISLATFQKWKVQVTNQDQNADNLEAKTRLFDHIANAKSELQVVALRKIEEATDWRAAAWKLERIFPRDFGNKLGIELDADVHDSRSMEIVHASYDLSQLSDEQLDQVMGILDAVKSEVIEVIEGEATVIE